MQRVDFLGAPGVGKSTLYGALLKRRSRTRTRWLTPSEAKVLVARQRALQGGWKKKLATVGLSFPPVQGVLADYLTRSDADRALRLNEGLGTYLELWEKALGDVLSSRERVLALVSWVHRTSELALFTAYLGNRVVLYDESYSKLICGWLTGLGASMAFITEFFGAAPAPAAVVWLVDPEPESIAPRLLKRVERKHGRDGQGRLQFGGIRWWHEEELSAYVEERLRYDGEAVRVLGERGVPVLRLDVRKPLTIQAGEVEEFLEAECRACPSAKARPA